MRAPTSSHLATAVVFGILATTMWGEDRGPSIPGYQVDALRGSGVATTGEGALEFLQSLVPSDEDKKAISKLVAGLGADSFVEREVAEAGLLGFGRQAVAPLEAARRSEEPESVLRARRLLGGVRLKHLKPAILGAFRLVGRDRPEGGMDAILGALPTLADPWLESQASEVLASIATEGDRMQLEAAAKKATNPISIRRASIRTLAAILDADGLATLEPLMEQQQPGAVRLATARALAERGQRSVLAPLVGMLESDDTETRLCAMSLLTTFTGERFGGAHYLEKLPADTLANVQRWLRDQGPTARLTFPLEEQVHQHITGYAVAIADEGVLVFDSSSIIIAKIACSPSASRPLPGGRFLVSEPARGRVIIYDTEGKALRTVGGLGSPTNAELLGNGNLLVVESGSGSVSEIDAAGERVWTVGGLDNPHDADRLPNGNTLVADSGHGRLVEFDPQGERVWEKIGVSLPNSVLRLGDGRTLYSTYTSGTLIMLDPIGRPQWSRAFDGATLLSIGLDHDLIHVSDAGSGRVFILSLDGSTVGNVALKQGFVDVGFVRE